MIELVVKHARLPDGKLRDFAIAGGRFVELEPGKIPDSATVLDAGGRVISPPFVDPHVHLDKALISEKVRDNRSGTLEEAIAIIWDYKRNYSHEEIIQRAERVLQWAVTNGTLAVRTHVDVDSIGGLTPLEALLEVRERWRDKIVLQIVAFPQEGILRDPGTERLLERAMAAGADVVGGMPFNERTEEDSRRHIEICFRIAKEHDADIDMHVDETDDPSARTLEYLAARTIAEEYQGRVTAGHTCALAAYDAPHAARVIQLVREAGIHMITNPATNLMLQGRHDQQPIRRGITRVKELLAAGINVSCGQDCLKDTFYPTFGRADMLEVGLITAHAAQLSTPAEIETLHRMITRNAARILRLENYGLQPGAPADFVLLDCPSVQEAFRTQPGREVYRRGKLVARRTVTAELLDPPGGQS
jgi:cytosine deaminase